MSAQDGSPGAKTGITFQEQEGDPIIHQLDKIVSNFKFLLPMETSKEELFIITNSLCEIRPSKTLCSEDRGYEIYFFIGEWATKLPVDFDGFIQNIEKNLRKKADIIFKWFPGCLVTEIKIVSFVGQLDTERLMR